MYSPDDRECTYCTKSTWRNGMCYEHWEEARQERAERLYEELREARYEEKIPYPSKDV